eukprot:3111410-Amphidinium_carterae.1
MFLSAPSKSIPHRRQLQHCKTQASNGLVRIAQLEEHPSGRAWQVVKAVQSSSVCLRSLH